jgi:hypothetical protein
MVLSLKELNARTRRVLNRQNEKTKRVIERTNNNIRDDFNTIGRGFNGTFNRDFGINLGLGLSQGFGDASQIIGKVTNVGDKIFDAPIVGRIIRDVAPEAYELNQALKGAGAATKGLSGLTDRENYRGQSGSKLAGNIIERTINTGIDTDRQAGLGFV